ncbi:MAG: DUF2156 domain-containing protein [Anaerolineae bacterium]|nr:DUF2156 domain-containing protein [Anaerolineae bacterium]
MTHYPEFPSFNPLAIEDRDIVHQYLWAYQPETSELTFTNFFIWRTYYDFKWAIYQDWLLIMGQDGFVLPPVGPPSRLAVIRMWLHWLRDELALAAPRIQRADARLVAELEEADDLHISPTREHFDYVYAREDLAELAGRKYSKKRNHINKFLRQYPNYAYAPLTEDRVDECLSLAEVWCQWRRCEEDLSLTHEFEGIRQSLLNLDALQIVGGLLLVDGQVQAITLGELLNAQTAVVHIEKANIEFQGIYPMINQLFVQNQWNHVDYVNREQDLGEPGLRKAKESYYPAHRVQKFDITLI